LIIADNEFIKPDENSENDNEFVLVRNVDTIHELYLLLGYHQSKSFNKKRNFTEKPTKKQINIMNNTQGQHSGRQNFMMRLSEI